MQPIDIIPRMESEVRGYVRSFPTVFSSANGPWLVNSDGRRFIDFFAGAGTLNYGHNHPLVKESLIQYIQNDGIQHSLDMATEAKIGFIAAIENHILKPRDLSYKIQFTGPTGTNAVEAAIKLAKKVTRRTHVVAFTGGYHGHSLGSLALTSNRYYHDDVYNSHNNVTHLPYDGYLGKVDTSTLLEKLLRDPSSGLPTPAAVILEPIQGEGGINVASSRWLQNVAEICQRYGVLLISDEIQVGNGRTGDFFAFEASGIKPDMVCLSKSLGGGLPISLVMMRPELDVWKPGQHTGTFRGNNLAFVAGRTLLDHFWADGTLSEQIQASEQTIRQTLESLAADYPESINAVRGRGMIWGIELKPSELAVQISRKAFELGLVIETCGPEDQVVKLLPPLVVTTDELDFGLQLLSHAVGSVLAPSSSAAKLSNESIACTDISAQPRNSSLTEQSINVLSNLTDELIENLIDGTDNQELSDTNVCGSTILTTLCELQGAIAPESDADSFADLMIGDGAEFLAEDADDQQQDITNLDFNHPYPQGQWVEETLQPQHHQPTLSSLL